MIDKLLKNKYFYFVLILLILSIRLALNAIVPLMDKTEARYAEIARLMYETNNWIMPQIDYGVDFWAKPPLSTWFSAFSMKIFGVNEFAVRLPYFLITIATLWVVGILTNQKKSSFYILSFLLLTVPEFLLHAGVVSTDTALNFCLVVVMLTYWKSVTENSSILWKYSFFIAIGLGLLAKGPIVIILTAPPIFVWMLIFGKYKSTWLNLPWITGGILSLLIAVPWYYLAEVHSKGFIDYFIVGEHFKRFFDATWSGDKYGFPKQQPFGIIWVFLLASSLPWILYVVLKLWKYKNQIFKNQWLAFLFLWMLWTPLFFTTSKSLIHTYTLPVAVPLALIVLHFYEEIKNKKLAISFALVLPILSLLFLVVSFTDGYKYYLNTDKYLVLEQREINPNQNLYCLNKKSYSSQFYSHGKVKSISIDELNTKTNTKELFYVLIYKRDLKSISNLIYKNFKLVSENKKKSLFKRILSK